MIPARNIRAIAIPLAVLFAVVLLVGAATRSPLRPTSSPNLAGNIDGIDDTVAKVDARIEERWTDGEMVPAQLAPELQVLRRLSLALHGTVPSLQEIRQFEADKGPDRLDRWTRRMLSDKRFSDYFAERLARSLVGTEMGQFIVFRRDRFVTWLSEQLEAGVPWNVMVREMISDQGLWTGDPATNFVTAAVNNGDVDENKLAGRTVRAFLGQRIDCAQCHDHPFESWKQEEFAGLAAFYGQVRPSLVGIEDRGGEFQYLHRKTQEDRVAEAAVPFNTEALPSEGTRRERLAAWITDPENRRFERAIANRVWGFLFGKAYIEPVDDLEDPQDEPDLLDVLGKDFREHNYDLRRLVQVISRSKPFRIDSVYPGEDADRVSELRDRWGVFPLVRLRPEQVIGSVLQSTSVTTIDQNSFLITRFIKFFRENDFVKEYGDLGDNELEERSGTIPQALLRMNGKLVDESLDSNPLSSVSRVLVLSRNNETCVKNAFLICLSRLPDETELAHFTAQLDETEKNQRAEVVEDMFWSMFNSMEFTWNH